MQWPNNYDAIWISIASDLARPRTRGPAVRCAFDDSSIGLAAL